MKSMNYNKKKINRLFIRIENGEMGFAGGNLFFQDLETLAISVIE